MGVTVAATRHHKPLPSIVHHLGLSLFNKGFGSCLVAYIDILAVLHGECFYHLIVLRSEDFAIDHKVGTGISLAAGKHTRYDDNTQDCK